MRACLQKILLEKLFHIKNNIIAVYWFGSSSVEQIYNDIDLLIIHNHLQYNVLYQINSSIQQDIWKVLEKPADISIMNLKEFKKSNIEFNKKFIKLI